MNSRRYAQIEQLYNEKKYSKCIESIDSLIKDEIPELSYQVMKAKCLKQMGRTEDISILWSSVDYENPSNADIEAIELIIEWLKNRNDDGQSDRFQSILNYLLERRGMEGDERKWIENGKRIDLPYREYYFEMAGNYFAINDLILSEFFYDMMMLQMGSDIVRTIDLGNALIQNRNIGNMRQILLDPEYETVAVILDQPENYERYMNIARALQENNKKPVFITLPIELDIEGELEDIQEYVEASISNMEFVDGIPVYVPIQFLRNQQYYDTNKLALLEQLAARTSQQVMPIITEVSELAKLRSRYCSRNCLHYICRNIKVKNAYSDNCFAYIGKYEIYESKMYHCNVIEHIEKESKHDISIVLPVRNNAETIGATLRTCMEQEGVDYEILICDNSDTDNFAIKDLLKKTFDSEKINYIRTPHILPITKSFEYAFLQANGDFLMPIGADDGVHLGALKKFLELKKQIELENKEECKVLSWDRTHFCWENFNASGQAGQMIIPKLYTKENAGYEKRDCKKQLEDVLIYPKLMYGIPICYINSGMKRQYMKELLQKTGAILDGHSQDLYTGLVNLILNEHYYHINYPITMAALSGNSSGAKSTTGSVSQNIALQRGEEDRLTNIMMPVPRDIEDILHPSDGDVANLICQFLRLIDMECIPVESIHKVPWYYIGKNIAEQIQYKDVNGTTVRKQLIHSIECFSKEDATKLEREMNNGTIQMNHFEAVIGKEYYKGFRDNGSLAIDATEFGVKDVYDACLLCKKILNIF